MPQIQNRPRFHLDWRHTLLGLLLLVGVVYMISVQHTHILMLTQELRQVEDPAELNYLRELIFSILIIVLQLTVIGGLLFLAIRTKSKGITLLFLAELTPKLSGIVTIVWMMYIVRNAPPYPAATEVFPPAMEIKNYVFSIIYPTLFLYGIYILYKEYKAGKLIPRATDEK